MKGSGGLTVRGLERGLDLLRAIERGRAMTATMLHRETRLPKPTITRLLRTLEQKGFVWRSIADGCYRVTTQKHGAPTMPAAGRLLAAVAGPVLDELCEEVRWPSDVSVRRQTYMQLCETSRRRAYFTLNRLEIGFRINMLLSAPGRAYLAWCPGDEREMLLRRLRGEAAAEQRIDAQWLRGPAALERLLERTRDQGYAVRDPGWGGDNRRPREEYDDGLSAIAVPILAGRRVLGCVNIVWITRVLSVEHIARVHAGRLQRAAREIAVLAQRSSN